jgi:hypothetical protein
MPDKENIDKNIHEEVKIEKTKESLGEKPEKETGLVKGIEKAIEKIEAISAQPTEKLGEGGLAGISQAQQKIKEQEKEVENILAENLKDIFLNLTPQKQQEFKIEGEKTAKKITKLLNSAKVNIRKIISLIKEWLSLIPGVNRFFLEQEAKIKADEIVKIKNEHK